jgi:hypothetical protein
MEAEEASPLSQSPRRRRGYNGALVRRLAATALDLIGLKDWRPIDLDYAGWRVVGHVSSVYAKVL